MKRSARPAAAKQLDLLSLLPPEIVGQKGPDGIRIRLRHDVGSGGVGGGGVVGDWAIGRGGAGATTADAEIAGHGIAPSPHRPGAPAPRLPQSPSPPVPQSRVAHTNPAGTTYAPIRVENGRVIRESRHHDSIWSNAGPGGALDIAPEAGKRQRGAREDGYVRWVRPAEGPGDPLRSLDYVIVDVETTGVGIGHRITEVCIVRLTGNGKPVGEYTTLVNPQRPIPAMIAELTNIDTTMVRDAPRFRDIAADVMQWLDGAVFVAHNASFDWHYISRELQHATGQPMRGRMLCTVRLARRVMPEIRERSLDALTWFFGVENEARHRAWGDARATAQLFRRMLDRIDEREITGWDELQRYLYARAPKKKRRAMPHFMEYAPE